MIILTCFALVQNGANPFMFLDDWNARQESNGSPIPIRKALQRESRNCELANLLRQGTCHCRDPVTAFCRREDSRSTRTTATSAARNVGYKPTTFSLVTRTCPHV